MFKNTAAKFMVFAFDTTNSTAKTGDAANITCYVSKDYGTVTVLADTSATEMDSTNAKGYYLFDAAQGETNGDCLMISAKSTTANIAVIGAPAVIYTRPTTNWLAPATLNRTLVVDAAGLADANTVKLGPTGSGTAQTARDIGTSVLLSTGTGTGQLDFTSGVVKANATQWLGGTIPAVNVTGVPLVDAKYLLGTIFSTPATAGIMDVNLKNIANATVSTASAQIGVNAVNIGGTAQTGRDLGASVLLSSGTGTGQLDFTSGVVKANLAQILGTALTETVGQIAAAFKKFFDIASPTSTMNLITAVTTTTTATNLTTNNDKTGYALSGTQTFNTTGNITGNLSGSVGSVTGLTASNLDTPISSRAAPGDAMALTAAYDFAKGTAAMTEAYAAKGATMTPIQALYQINQHLGESSIASTTKTVKKRNGSTTAKTFTLDSATVPTSITEAT